MANVFIYGPYGYQDYNSIKVNTCKLLHRINDIKLILFTASIARIDDSVSKLASEMNWPLIKVNGIDEVYDECDIAIIFKSANCTECVEAIKLLKDVPIRIINIEENENP